MMNQGRNNQENGAYQNVAHAAARRFQNRPCNNTPQQPPQQPPQQQQEPEENIYERLDNDDDEDDGANARDAPRNESLAPNNPDHMYERIGERISCSGRAHCPGYRYHRLNHVSAHSFLNDVDGARNASQYDQLRHIYLDYSRLSGNLCQSSLSRLGRNCFSTENIAYASTRRSVHPFVYNNCTCSYCRHVDARYLCQHCHNLHNRLRYQEAAATSRHYVYQLSRNCRCPFCRGEYPYTKFPINGPRAAELFRMECCHCRNPASCSCRGKIPSDASSAIYIGRYLDWISRTGQSVNNPLYATIHVGRIDRASGSNASNSGSNQPADPGPSTSNNATSRFNEPNSSILRSVFAPAAAASTSNAFICPVNRYVERQHTCDDSCIRGQSSGLAGICQLLGRCERTECNHGRLSVHWWFVNKWLPMWNSHHLERNVDGAPYVDEASREQRESDSDDS
ncbi:PREDICTED: uncharacterized protein LOC106746721 [Dinoponera quadriceps]|uniref:Uncharacterized protein LOC106746721 n=1 Tax=Dinoponera quadriceps TaxID=609295 RepID=A0A6P3XMB4_DINQU|nr:PREDICTED: uncharacterized protein LOC106746721 [Dinoponera quadriceps]